MYTGRTLNDLARELNRQNEVKRDFRSPSTLLEMSARQPKTIDIVSPDQSLELALKVGDAFDGTMTELMHDQVSKWAGIPSAYYDRMRMGSNTDQELLAQNMNHWFKAQKKETRLVRTLDGRARAFLSNRYRTIDNYDVANAALPVLVDESKKLGSVEIVSADVTEKALYLKVMSKRLTYEVKKGDVVQAGIVIRNSEVGQGSVGIEPFLYRLACLNGAIISDAAMRKYHIGRVTAELDAAEQVFRDETRKADDHAFVLKLQDVIRAAFNDANFEKLKGITIDATTRKVEAPIQDVVEEIADLYHLSERHRASFLDNLINGGDTTQWGFANAVTAIANKAESYEVATELERVGGSIMTLDKQGWERLAAA